MSHPFGHYVRLNWTLVDLVSVGIIAEPFGFWNLETYDRILMYVGVFHDERKSVPTSLSKF